MPKIKISSDGTRKGTQLLVDGTDITDERTVVSITFNAFSEDEWITFGYDTEEEYDGSGGGSQRVSYNYRNDKADRFRAERKVKGFKEPEETTDEEVPRIGGTKYDVGTKDRVERLIKVSNRDSSE